MTDQPSPPPPPPASPPAASPPPVEPQPATAAPPPKKGFGPWAWVLIGCLGLLLVAFLLMGTCTYFAAKKVKEVAEDFEANPARAAAELVVRTNPDLELVDSDEEDGTLTIRNTDTGEVVTFNYDEISQGRFSFEADGKTFDIGADEEGEGGVVKVTDESGAAVFQAGAGAMEDVPDWIPQYPGSSPEAAFSAVADGRMSGSFSLETEDSVNRVMQFYEEQFGDLGMQLQKTTQSGSGTDGGVLSGESNDPKRGAVVVISGADGMTRVVVNFTEGG